MTATSRRKGARAEADLVTYLRAHGWPYAERRASGTPGPDVTGCPGLAWEAKNAARLELAAWTDQAETQRRAAGAPYGPLVIKRRGKADPADWYAVMPLAQLITLLTEAGWAGTTTADAA